PGRSPGSTEAAPGLFPAPPDTVLELDDGPRAGRLDGGRHASGELGVGEPGDVAGPDPAEGPELRGWQRRLAREGAAVVHEHEALAQSGARCHPVEDEEPAEREVRAELLPQLARAGGAWRLVGLDGAAGQQPRRPVRRLDEEDAVRGVVDER